MKTLLKIVAFILVAYFAYWLLTGSSTKKSNYEEMYEYIYEEYSDLKEKYEVLEEKYELLLEAAKDAYTELDGDYPEDAENTLYSALYL